MNLLTILKQKIILNHFGQFVSHVSPIISPYFSIFLHAKGDVDIILFKINKILLDNRKVVNIFNNYFQSVTENLDLFDWPDERKSFYEIDKFWSQKLFLKKTFVFKLVTKQLVGDIPLNLLKDSAFVLPYLVRCINKALVKSKITNPFKLPNSPPVHKKEYPTDKANCRPVSVLPLPKGDVRIALWVLEQLFESPTMWFYKAHSNQCALFRLVQFWKRELGHSSLVGTLLMDLSKVYDCLPRDLLIEKPE